MATSHTGSHAITVVMSYGERRYDTVHTGRPGYGIRLGRGESDYGLEPIKIFISKTFSHFSIFAQKLQLLIFFNSCPKVATNFYFRLYSGHMKL